MQEEHELDRNLSVKRMTNKLVTNGPESTRKLATDGSGLERVQCGVRRGTGAQP